jgi:hypothetical protein
MSLLNRRCKAEKAFSFGIAVVGLSGQSTVTGPSTILIHFSIAVGLLKGLFEEMSGWQHSPNVYRFTHWMIVNNSRRWINQIQCSTLSTKQNQINLLDISSEMNFGSIIVEQI